MPTYIGVFDDQDHMGAGICPRRPRWILGPDKLGLAPGMGASQRLDLPWKRQTYLKPPPKTNHLTKGVTHDK